MRMKGFMAVRQALSGIFTVAVAIILGLPGAASAARSIPSKEEFTKSVALGFHELVTSGG